MPIKPENRHRYPARKEWLKIRAAILKRANNHCEFCGVKNYSLRGTTKIILTIAHLDQMPENNHPDNLAALCQRCHLKHDKFLATSKDVFITLEVRLCLTCKQSLHS